jgi:hypothetical protein
MGWGHGSNNTAPPFQVYLNDLCEIIGICCDIHFFISNFINLDLSILLLVRMAKHLLFLFISLKSQLFVSLIPHIVFSVSMSSIFALVFIFLSSFAVLGVSLFLYF